ncbi:MAG TPA: hypothetical protein VFP57_01090 [Sphingomicrobium sp.]|nr:hypothetical protein [Sphingomicrobium sp.]
MPLVMRFKSLGNNDFSNSNFSALSAARFFREFVMFKSLAALALVGATAAPAIAQQAQSRNPAPVVQSPTASKAVVQKKVVCERINDDETGSRITTKKVCRTVEVSARPGQQPATTQAGGADN